MAIQTINLGTGTSGIDGDTNRSAFQKVNANFAELKNHGDQNTSGLQAQIDQNLSTLNQQDIDNKAALEQQISDLSVVTSQQISDLSLATNTALATKVQKDQNLADLPDKATARGNLDVDQAGTAVAMAVALG